jgi:hypothetical protein
VSTGSNFAKCQRALSRSASRIVKSERERLATLPELTADLIPIAFEFAFVRRAQAISSRT